jgi:hypothetical protein
VRFHEALAVEGGIDVRGMHLAGYAAQEAAQDAPAADRVQQGDLLGHAQRLLAVRDGVAQDEDLSLLGAPDQRPGSDAHR